MYIEKTLPDKAVKFGARMIKLHQSLMKEHNEPVVSEQIIEDTMCIGIFIHEAQLRSHNEEVVSILKSALDRAAAAEYWISLLFTSGYIGKVLLQSLTEDCKEIQQLIQNCIFAAEADETSLPVKLNKGN